MNASALAGESRLSMPRNRTPLDAYFWESAASVGASAREGEHQEPQKLRTTTVPRYADRLSFEPLSVVPEMSGAAGRSPGLNIWAPVLPVTKLAPLLFGVLAAIGPLAQALTARLPATAIEAAATARRPVRRCRPPAGDRRPAVLSRRPARAAGTGGGGGSHARSGGAHEHAKAARTPLASNASELMNTGGSPRAQISYKR